MPSSQAVETEQNSTEEAQTNSTDEVVSTQQECLAFPNQESQELEDINASLADTSGKHGDKQYQENAAEYTKLSQGESEESLSQQQNKIGKFKYAELSEEQKMQILKEELENLFKNDHNYKRVVKFTHNDKPEEINNLVEFEAFTEQQYENQHESFRFDVTCTPLAKEFLLSSHSLVRNAAQVIQELANGRRTKNLSKPVKGTTERMFEARLDKAKRILWRLDATYSPQRKHHCHVIQILNVALDHDKIEKAAKEAEKWIKQGSIQGNVIRLRCIENGMCDGTDNHTTSYFEVIKESDVNSDADSILMRNDGGVIPSYSLSETTIRLLLDRARGVFGLPLKVSEEEDKIIFIKHQEDQLVNLAYHKVSLVCIGRSGTGKTTCCLMRLANEFLCYWRHLNKHKDPIIPRQILYTCISNKQDNEVMDDEVANEVTPNCMPLEENVIKDIEEQHDALCADTPSDAKLQDNEMNAERVCDHLHQVFVTKSPHLCSQVQQKFHETISGEDCVKFEFQKNWPYKYLSQFKETEYPLFITSQDLLILLDATVGGKPFFKRKNDGSLAVKITNTELAYDKTQQDIIGVSADDDESSSEAELDDDNEEMHVPENAIDSLPELTEVSARYFREEIWPKILRKMPNHDDLKKAGIDPTFVWQEIKSFIKGSVKALMNDTGHLDIKEYCNYGKKKASHYKDQREIVYACFEHYKKICSHEMVFDECDLLHHIYKRLKELDGDLSWVVHNFYIDEVQDFTEAELFLLLSCSRCPNGNFLCGDTAQSIMKGVSFRFKDVSTLFHCLQEKHKDIKVDIPRDIHKLTINYRSHVGILRLADSVIDLLERFFEDSFDSIEDDSVKSFPTEAQKPMVLEYSDIDELAHVLAGSATDTNAQIDFGAHQAIIVQTQKAKQDLPSTLRGGIVLTVYEAKGLEFDDVLLFNFFSDSQVCTCMYDFVKYYILLIGTVKKLGTCRST